MTVLFFANNFLEYGNHLRQKIEKIIESGQLIECSEISRLTEHLLNRTADAQICIFCVEYEFDLDRLLTIQNLLESVYIILILPYIDDDMIAKCHRLRSRFISYPDTQFEDVVTLMNHLQWVRSEKNNPAHKNIFNV